MAKPPSLPGLHFHEWRSTPVDFRSYVARVVDEELDALLGSVRALSLDGAKGVGKTATAVRRVKTVYELDNPQTASLIQADLGRLTMPAGAVLIDEWQRLPASWDVVRRAVDRGTGGPFLLTGSASPVSPGTHSGAGRIVRVQMRPMTLTERGVGVPSVSLAKLISGKPGALTGETGITLADYAREIVQSGFPAFRSFQGRALRSELDGYLERIVDRDIAEVGPPVRNPASLRRWMAAYAAASSTPSSFEAIRDAATGGQKEKPAKSAVSHYRELLERIWILDPVPAWLPSNNRLSRLNQAPKHHLVDPALACRLLGVDIDGLIDNAPPKVVLARDTTLLAQLFESLAALSLRVYAQNAECRLQHLRTRAGEHEVDFIVERGDGRVLALEVKLTQSVSDDDVRHLQWLKQEIGSDLIDRVVLTTGRHAYRRKDGVAVVPLALLGP